MRNQSPRGSFCSGRGAGSGRRWRPSAIRATEPSSGSRRWSGASSILEARPVWEDKGVWAAGKVYDPGHVVSHDGGAWVCKATHYSVGREPNHECFRLFVMRGARGRSAKDVEREGAR